MMRSDIKTLKQTIAPIIWLNCIFCMGIFEIPTNHPRYFLSIFYVISVLTGYIILFYKESHIFRKILEIKIFYFVAGVNILVATLAIILFWCKSENINNIIKKSNLVDNTFKAIGIKTDYQKTFRNILYITVIWIVSMIAINLINALWVYHDVGYWGTLYINICICFPIMINSVVDLTFASFIRCLQIKFQKINTLMKNVVLSANESNTFKIHKHDNTSIVFVMANYKNHKDKIMHLIQTIRHLHLEMTRIGREINYAYCLQLLLELAVHFTIVTSTVYCLYGVFSGQLSSYNEKIISMTTAAFIYSFKIILLNCLCTNVSTEAYKTGEIIQSLEGPIFDDDMKEEIHQFTQQIMLNSLNFTAFGCFSINNSLTGKFFATVMTYVVILIQMNTSVT